MKTGEWIYLGVSAALLVGAVPAIVRRRTVAPRATHDGRLATVQADLVRSLGRPGAYLAQLSAAVAPILLLGWPLGMLARHDVLHRLNVDVLHHFDHGLDPRLTSAMRVLTQMGNFWQIVTGAAVLGGLLALATRRHRWVPVLLVVTALVSSRYLVKVVANITRVPHPPTDLGTYPSGGVTRVIVVYGVLFLLASRLFAVDRPRWRAAVWSLLVLMTWTEIYSRIHLQKHWVLDTVGGVIVGVLTLAAIVVASRVLPSIEPVGRRIPDQRRHRHPVDRAPEPAVVG